VSSSVCGGIGLWCLSGVHQRLLQREFLFCAYRSLLCAYRSLLSQVVCVEKLVCGSSLVYINGFATRECACVYGMCFIFCVHTGLFCVHIGLFCVHIGLFCVHVGLFCVE